MSEQLQSPRLSKGAYRTGWVLSGLAIAFMVMDSVMKLLALPVVLQASGQLGFVGVDMAHELGVILLTCTVLYAIPRTAVLGAVLLTGYLGGAVASHLRLHDPLSTHILSGVYGGLLVWGGLYLRDLKLRAIFPLRLPSGAT